MYHQHWLRAFFIPSECRWISSWSCILQCFTDKVTMGKNTTSLQKQELMCPSAEMNTPCSFHLAETAPRHARQVPRLVPLRGGRPLLHQHRLSAQLPPVARGKEPNHYRFLSATAAPYWYRPCSSWQLVVSLLSEAFRAPVFTNGPDKSGFSLGFGRNVAEVFGDRPKYWMLPVFSRRVHFDQMSLVTIN